MKRRDFLISSGIGAAGLLQPSGATASVPAASDLFTLGVASGDPTSDGVVLWTRLAPDPLNGGGMDPAPVVVRWQVAHDSALQRVVRQGFAIAWPSLAHSVHVEVDGLAADRWYYYQFSAAGRESPISHTRTLPQRQASPASFRFAFVSCQDWQNGFYSAYRNLAREALDFVVHLGDYIYEGGADPAGARQHDGPEPMSLVAYRNRHALYKTDPHLQAAHAAFPWLAVPDDHEVENNYAGANSEGNVDPNAFLKRRADAYRAYYEHMPLRARSFPVGAAMRLYRGLTVGDLVRFSALDTRQYRTNQPCGDGPRFACAGEFNPFQTMTGPAQERWLFNRLGRSRARWNVVAQQTMFSQFDFLAGKAQVFNMDQWDGYVAARTRVTGFLREAAVSNPMVLSGDIHSNWVHNIKTNFDDPTSATIGTELVGMSITSAFPAVLIIPVSAALKDNPHTLFFDGQHHGYVRCTITPKEWRADFRAVPTILADEVEAFTLASFVVLDGQPGALPG